MRQACRQVAHAAVKYKKIAVAGGVPDGASYARLIADGYSRLIFAAIDTDVLASGVTQRVSEWSKQLASNAPA